MDLLGRGACNGEVEGYPAFEDGSEGFVLALGVTGRGMTQCISASLLELDRWSHPNMTVPSLILSKDCVNFIYLLY